MKRSALFLSPHLDDVAFSCGGTLIGLVEAGWHVQLCTVFTASVSDPRDFALACQLDKGLSAEIDYMALRRQEDRAFAALAGVKDLVHLAFPEAPHRGYRNAADLFAGMHEGDEVWRPLSAELRRRDFDLIAAPQGLGNHVDHLQVIRAVLDARLEPRTIWYADTPYAIRNPTGAHGMELPIDLDRKIEAAQSYRSQVPFQFGSDDELRAKLTHFHRRGNRYAETFVAGVSAEPLEELRAALLTIAESAGSSAA